MSIIFVLGIVVVLLLLLSHPSKCIPPGIGTSELGLGGGWKKITNLMDGVIHPVTGIESKKSIEYTPYVYLTISHNGTVMGDIVIQLYDVDLPKTTNNFRTLCMEKRYNHTPFHRIRNGFMVQGGDITNHDGSGGESIYGSDFEDEGFLYKNEYGTISMANGGPNTNNSQFFINTCTAGNPHLDQIHVVFGKVVYGMDVVTYMEQSDHTETNERNEENTHQEDTRSMCVVVDSGEIWMDDENQA